MADDQALGPRRFDFASLSPELFEELCFALVRLEHPEAVRLTAPDHGLDCLLPAGPDGRVPRGWQAKRFTQSISWPQCRASLERAIVQHSPTHVTFAFARDLTAKQHALFARHLAEPHPEITVDYWGASGLADRLNTSNGRDVARRFFGDPAVDAEHVARAVRAGGELAGAADALDRQAAIGEFHAGRDPFFAYPSSQRETEGPEPFPMPGAIASIERIGGGVTARLDVVPRSPTAARSHGLAASLRFSPDDAGRKAREAFERAERHGGRVELDEDDASFTIDRAPPGLQDLLVDLPTKGRVVIEIPERRGVEVRIRASPPGAEAVETKMTLRGERTDETDRAVFSGSAGGLRATVSMTLGPGEARLTDSTFTWEYTSDGSRPADQVLALDLVIAAEKGCLVELLDADTGRLLLAGRSDSRTDDPWLHQMRDAMATLARREAISGESFEVPHEIEPGLGVFLMALGDLLRNGGGWGTWDALSLVIRPEGLAKLAAGGELVLREKAAVQVLGNEIQIGDRVIEFPRYEISSTEPTGPGSDADLKVTFIPPDEDAARVWMQLVAKDAATTA